MQRGVHRSTVQVLEPASDSTQDGVHDSIGALGRRPHKSSELRLRRHALAAPDVEPQRGINSPKISECSCFAVCRKSCAAQSTETSAALQVARRHSQWCHRPWLSATAVTAVRPRETADCVVLQITSRIPVHALNEWLMQPRQPGCE